MLVRETRALAVLVFRYWARAGLPTRLRRDQGRRASGGLFRAAALALMANWGYTTGHAVARAHPIYRDNATAWLIVGIVGFAWSWGMLGRIPSMRGLVSPLQAPLLDLLPLSEASRVIVGLFERLLAYAIGVAAVGFATREPRGALLGFAAVTFGLLGGDATIRLTRVLVAPARVARAGVAMIVLQVPSMLVFVSSPMLGSFPRTSRIVSPVLPLASAAQHGPGFWMWMLAPLVAIALASALIRLAERLGYDHGDVVPQTRIVRAESSELTVSGVEGVLVQREPGGKWGVRLMAAYVALFSIGAIAVAYLIPRRDEDDLASLKSTVRVIAALTSLIPFSLAMGRATRMVHRDVVARPLLAALPIAPSDLLRGKSRSVVRQALIVASPSLLLLLMPWRAGLHPEMAWRGATIAVALVASAVALVSIAFLTEGVGTLRLFGGSVTLETTLVMVPLLAVGTAPYAWHAVVALSCLVLLAFEARRTALRAVRWIDDPDDFDRETPPWRALLVLAAFQAAQMFVMRGLLFSGLDLGACIAIAYAASAVVLVTLTAYARRGMTPMRVMPKRASWLAAGLALGVASGGIAWLTMPMMRGLGVELPKAPETTAIAIGAAAIALLVAPVVEEVFFRGWLQSAIAGELPPHRAFVAPLVTAMAFAVVHPPHAFPAVLVLGLATGALYAKTSSIAPGIVAHAAYAAIALYVTS
jgi:membrane protease YdiL (CAAX protease family)